MPLSTSIHPPPTFQGRPPTPLESALCGCAAGSFAAVVTTPLDVAKTRIMLMESYSGTGQVGAIGEETTARWTTTMKRPPTPSVPSIIGRIYREEGFRRLYSGVLPRTAWISTGGFIFFFGYEFAMKFSHQLF